MLRFLDNTCSHFPVPSNGCRKKKQFADVGLAYCLLGTCVNMSSKACASRLSTNACAITEILSYRNVASQQQAPGTHRRHFRNADALDQTLMQVSAFVIYVHKAVKWLQEQIIPRLARSPPPSTVDCFLTAFAKHQSLCGDHACYVPSWCNT